MLNDELKNYLDQLKKQNPPIKDDVIREELQKVGWDLPTIEEAVIYFNKVSFEPVSKIFSPSENNEKSEITNVGGQSSEIPAQNLSQQKQVFSPGSSSFLTTSDSAKNPIEVKSDFFAKKGVKIILGVFILLIILSTASVFAYSYLNKVWFFAPKGPYKAESIASQIFAGFGKISYANYEVNLVVETSQREKGVIPVSSLLPVSTSSPISNVSSYSNFLPSDFKLVLTFSGTTQTSDSVIPFRGDSNFSGNLSIASTSNYILKISMIKMDNASFIRLNDYPSTVLKPLGISLDPIVGKWIKFDLSSSTMNGISRDFSLRMGNMATTTKANDFESDIKILREQVAIIKGLIDEQKLISIVGAPEEEIQNGEKLFRYQIVFNWDKLASFYQRASEILSQKYKDKAIISNDESVKEATKIFSNPDFLKAMNYQNSNSKMLIWANESGIPMRLQTSSRIAPDDKLVNFKNKQINSTVSLTLKNINKPQDIAEPTQWISLTEVNNLLNPKQPVKTTPKTTTKKK